MDCRICHRHSIFCILPPHMLDHIARHGPKKQAARALAPLSLATTHRMRRAQLVGVAAPRLATAPVKQRSIFDARHKEESSGALVRAEGQAPTDDVAVNEAYDGLGDTRDFYDQIFARNSIDDRGMALNAYVHYGDAYDNAFWDGHEMNFGDGDGELFNRFTISIDVIGHELTHGVTGSEADLVYHDQPGALNESISDVFGSLVKQRVLGQTAEQADWLIGAGLLAASVQGVALRSMTAPGTAYDDPTLGKDPQPADMSGYVHSSRDNGGVHINSGIPNRAFYLAATGIGGHAWEKAGRIWYQTLTDSRLKRTATFARLARLTIDNAAKLYGIGSAEQEAVVEAWRTVGVVKADHTAVA
jgi:Zn-dependent metalloprotease